jgi:PAS domain S-box-containing protein
MGILGASVVGVASGLAFILLYVVVGWVLRDFPLALSIFGNAGLLVSASVVPAVILRRRRHWAGCQRLFWDAIAVAMFLWVVGHLGWAFHALVLKHPSWLQWHTLFSLCAGIGPLIALLARPHRGVRSESVTTVAIDLATYGLLAVFVYSYFVLVPSLAPGAQGVAETRLLYFVQANRLLLLAGLAAALWIARGTNWRATYARLAIGVAIGFTLRIGTNMAISRGEYYVGSIHDLAWIVPWLCYAWAASEAPSSPSGEQGIDQSVVAGSVVVTAVPAFLIPLIGYSMLNFESMGAPIDSFRVLLTSLATVGALGLLTLRLAAQGGELQRADARLKILAAATEQTGDLILITRADGTFEHANAAFVRALGYSRRELTGFGFSELIGANSPKLGREIPTEVTARGVWRGTLVRQRKDGTTFPVACTVAAMRNANGTITHFVGVERDITEEIKLRDQLVHSERLSAVGELVAGVAHEINNPLQTIIGCVELMLDEPEGPTNRQDLDLVRREATRAGQIVRNLLSFIRRGAPDRTAVDLNNLVETTAKLREYHLQQQSIQLVLRLSPAPLPVVVNREEVQQIILNLLLNAEHAIVSASGPGSITVETSGDGVRQTVEVTDSGPGISPELRGRIFEPFFTTKEVGEGTGLGLSISHGIASAHGGSLALVDAPVGAKFRLTLPAHISRQSSGERADVPHRALVVDDEAPIRRLMTRLLERRGFEVIEAGTGDEAIAIGANHSLSLVICDVGVPGVHGPELYRLLAAANPLLARQFIFITGDATYGDRLASEDVRPPVLTKPFTAADLDAVLAQLGVRAAVGETRT